MFGLFHSTPQYAGEGQPAANSSNGALGFLSGLFAFPGTPTYATASRAPSQGTGAMPAPEPTTEPAINEPVLAINEPVEQVSPQPVCTVPLPFAIVVERSPQCP